MGILKPIREHEKAVLHDLELAYNGLNWCELGNQVIVDTWHQRGDQAIVDSFRIAKHEYELLGVNHTSIDLNGNSGALVLDLSKPLPEQFANRFDVITNYGTIEHVENQYEVFRNVHKICKANGVMLHAFPLINNWPKHCRYYYELRFVDALSRLCGYEILRRLILDDDYFEFPRNLLFIAFRKNNSAFISQEVFEGIEGLYDSGDRTQTQNYTQAMKQAPGTSAGILAVASKIVRRYSRRDRTPK